MAVTLGSSYDSREVTTTTTKHSRKDADGIRVIETRAPRKRRWLALVAGGAVAGLWLGADVWSPREVTTGAASATEDVASAPAPEAAPAPRLAEKPIGLPVLRTAPPPATSQEEEELALERKLADEPTFTIKPPGSPRSGMALFPPPGSQPLLRGLVVPKGFELPEGYVRHHQVTDDGQPLPAILMFHPDYEWVDDGGEPIALPADRVVPAELAPEGMPIERLAPPGSNDSGPGSSS